MPSYHSILYTDDKNTVLSCGFPLINFDSNKTPVLDYKKIKEKSNDVDLLDEALTYFRLNVLFKNYPIKSDGDKLIVYSTVFISKCLEIFFNNSSDIKKCKDLLKELILEAEWSPNYKSHFLNGILTSSENSNSNNNDNLNSTNNSNFNFNSNEILALQKYLKSVRTELVYRINYILFDEEGATSKNKFWLPYAKKKFLGFEMPVVSKFR